MTHPSLPSMHGTGKRAFSLLEIMIVLVIFSMIATGSLGILTDLLHSQKMLEARGQSLEELQTLLLTSRKNISQIVPKSNSAAVAQSGDKGSSYVTQSGNGSLFFVRGGWNNPLGEQRSNLAYSRYILASGIVREIIWPFIGYSPDQPSSVSQDLASDAVNMQIQAIEKAPDVSENNSSPAPAGAGTGSAPPSSTNAPAAAASSPTLPVALRLVFVLGSLGAVEEFVPLVETP